jgi:hypothetical protein
MNFVRVSGVTASPCVAHHVSNSSTIYLNLSPPTDELGGFTFGLEYTPEADAAESVPGACSTKLLSVSLFL